MGISVKKVFKVSTLVLVCEISWGEEILTLEPVIVIGNRLQDDAEIVERGTAGISYQELLEKIPSAYGGNPTNGLLSVRGMNLDGVAGGVGAVTNPVVNVFENGVVTSVNTLRFLPTPVLGMESYSLRKSPGTNGAGPASMAGELHMKSTEPGFSFSGQSVVEFSEEGTFASFLSQDVPLLDNELTFGLSYYHFETNGHESAPAAGGNDFGAYHRDRWQAQMLWHPGGNQENRILATFLYEQGDGNLRANTAIVPGVLDLYDRVSLANRRSSYPAERWLGSIEGEFILPNEMKLHSMTSLQSLELGQSLDFDGTSALDWTINGDLEEQHFSQSLALSRQEGAWSWEAGGYYQESRYDVVYSGVAVFPIPAGSPYSNQAVTDAQTWSLHGKLTRDLPNEMRVTAGLRYQADERDLVGDSVFGPFPTMSVNESEGSGVFLPSVQLEWQPEEETTLKLSLAQGYRAGGVAFAPVAGVAASYDEESSWDLDLTGRYQVTKNFHVGASLFYSWLEDQQVAATVPGGLPGIDVLVTNAGESYRYGGEVEAHWQAMDGLSLHGSAGYLQTEFEDLALDGVDRSGLEFPNAPEWSLNLGVDYRHDSGLFGSVNYSWTDTTYSLVSSPETTELESRSLLSARLGWAWEGGQVYLFGSNLLNDEYALYRAEAVPPVIPQLGKAGAPRTFGLGMELRW